MTKDTCNACQNSFVKKVFKALCPVVKINKQNLKASHIFQLFQAFVISSAVQRPLKGQGLIVKQGTYRIRLSLWIITTINN